MRKVACAAMLAISLAVGAPLATDAKAPPVHRTTVVRHTTSAPKVRATVRTTAPKARASAPKVSRPRVSTPHISRPKVSVAHATTRAKSVTHSVTHKVSSGVKKVGTAVKRAFGRKKKG
jgi:hypothetical protein